MYCPGCGLETTQGLNFCKQCGASLAAPDPGYSPSRPPAWLILSFLALIGLIAIIGLVGATEGSVDLKRNGFESREIVFICLAVMGGAVLMIAFLGRLFFRLLSLFTGVQPEQRANSLSRTSPISPRRISAPPLGIPNVPSVTEQTTRSFDLPEYPTDVHDYPAEEKGKTH
jgi:hypothetical protein